MHYAEDNNCLEQTFMFTGIIEKKGIIERIENRAGKIYFYIKSGNFLSGVKIGSSISCDGTCLTVAEKKKDAFIVELMPETLALTAFIDARAGDEINLEKAMMINHRLDGHFVTGHIDGVGVINKIINDNQYVSVTIKAPRMLKRYLARKGSVAVNGVSLTIAGTSKDWFKVCLITHTLEKTNLSKLKQGDKVNLEIDIIARYLEKLIKK